MNKIPVEQEEQLHGLRQNCESLIRRIMESDFVLTDDIMKKINLAILATSDAESAIFVHNFKERMSN